MVDTKKFALITLRYDYLSERKEGRDSIDTSIYSLIADIGLIPLLVPNNPDNIEPLFNLVSKSISLVVFTGGNSLSFLDPSDASCHLPREGVDEFLYSKCLESSIPMLGICRGMQYISYKLGFLISPIDNHVNLDHNIYFPQTDTTTSVNSYHSWSVSYPDTLPVFLDEIAIDDSGNLEMIYSKKLQLMCFMWHPERSNGLYTLCVSQLRKLLSNKP